MAAPQLVVLLGLVAGIAEHHALVARSLRIDIVSIDALADICRLSGDVSVYLADLGGCSVHPYRVVNVADCSCGLTCYSLVIRRIPAQTDLACQYDDRAFGLSLD